ncbi:MAG: trypsin-like peptidase domain-containing protein [Candidatus Eisenbacteria bacterium]|nr:trypsin-like peptidase domain-containing protein [Candidatus Eisenbacteria bacterium]
MTAGQGTRACFGTSSTSAGTGFLLEGEGIVVTANHVVAGAHTIMVRFPDHDWVQASIASQSPRNDLATLRVEPPTDTRGLHLGSSSVVHTGAAVYTVGYPVVSVLGDEPKYTDGVISSMTGLQGDHALFQITVPIQPGNSGGPLISADGTVIGVIVSSAAVASFYSLTESLPQNVNWAVKSDYVTPLLGESAVSGSEQRSIVEVVSAVCQIRATKG